MSYSEKLKDPRWQKKRLEILSSEDWSCALCLSKNKTLHVHHKYYTPNTDPWDYDDSCYVILCEDCHKEEHEALKTLEKHLLNCVRRQFMASEIKDICFAFLNMKQDHIPEVTATALKWALTDRESMSIITRMYFLFLKGARNNED